MSPRIGLTLHTILQTTTEIADTYGIEEVTLARLAKKLDIRTPSLYNHIDGLPGLKKKLAVYGLEKLYRKLTRATVGRSSDDAVHSLGEAFITFARNHPGLYEATLRAPDHNDVEAQQVGGDIVDLVVQVFHAYKLNEDAALHAVRAFRSLIHGFALLEQKGAFGLPLDHDVSFHLMIDAFLAGIHKMNG